MTRPKLRDLVYRAAARSRTGDPAAAREEVEALFSLDPDFDAERFVRGLPYEHERERTSILDALRAAGL